MRLMQRVCPLAVVVSALFATNVSAETIATFADPALDGSTPLFSLVGNQLSGGWSGPNLDLLTPGLPVTPNISNATFTMTPLTATLIATDFYSLNAGEIKFFDASNTLVFDITFQSATLATNIGIGASDLALQDVSFAAPLEAPTTTFSNERFAFSFANDVVLPQDGKTWTASFTSSSTVIPEPASAGLLAGGGVLIGLLRRRR